MRPPRPQLKREGVLMSELLTYREVAAQTGLHRSTIHRAVRAGRFPAPIRKGARTVAFLASEVRNWIASRERVDYGQPDAAS